MTESLDQFKHDFPVLKQEVNGKPLVYLDHGATNQKPQQVIDRMTRFYQDEYATIHRGVYHLSQQATQFCDDVRQQVADFVGADRVEEVVFVRGTTEGINLVAYGIEPIIQPNQAILITHMEHHSNIVPWQNLCERRGCELLVAPVLDDGSLDEGAWERLLADNDVALVAFNHVSNTLGTVNDIVSLTQKAKSQGALVLIDGAQSVAHYAIDFKSLGCDFYVFSGHKMYGPAGIGCLVGRYEVLDQMRPYQSGGDMIESVSFDGTTYAKVPQKFEAGTPALADIVGLGAALDYIKGIGLEVIHSHEQALLKQATTQLSEIPSVRFMGTAQNKSAVISFTLGQVHPHDIGTVLDMEGVAIRAGHHCTQPLMERFGVPATARASFGVYNTLDDIDRLVSAIKKAEDLLG